MICRTNDTHRVIKAVADFLRNDIAPMNRGIMPSICGLDQRADLVTRQLALERTVCAEAAG